MSADIAECCMHPKAQYLWLTKRPRNMLHALEPFRGRLKHLDKFFGHQWFGFTAENQEWFNKRVMEAAEIPLVFKQWLSVEPLLGPIDMCDMVEMFKWVVVGCESGNFRRPCKMEWVESVVQQCMAAKVPVFVKQLDINGQCVTDINKFPAHLRVRQVPWARGLA